MPKVGEPNPNGIRLKPQQQKFLDNYLHKDMTQTAAARASGYNHPTVQAVQLLNNPVVRGGGRGRGSSLGLRESGHRGHHRGIGPPTYPNKSSGAVACLQ
jgi:hypothetical protein